MTEVDTEKLAELAYEQYLYLMKDDRSPSWYSADPKQRDVWRKLIRCLLAHL